MSHVLLDLFCGAGGAAMGYHRAGFEVVGVDIAKQPHYPFEFIQADAIEYVGNLIVDDESGMGTFPFDVIHASPPCQRWSDLAHRNRNADDWPDLIAPTRDLLADFGLPWVIENVEGAPLLDPIVLCGQSFGLRVIRHRLFESNRPLTAPAHRSHPLVYTRDKRKAHYGLLNEWTSPVSVTGGGNSSVAAARDAMGIDWMTKDELNEAIPPAFTEHLGRQLLSPEPAPMTDTTAPRTAAGQRLLDLYFGNEDDLAGGGIEHLVRAIERERDRELLALVRAAQELSHAWTIPEYPHPGLREDALIDALAALPESVRVAARKPE